MCGLLPSGIVPQELTRLHLDAETRNLLQPLNFTDLPLCAALLTSLDQVCRTQHSLGPGNCILQAHFIISFLGTSKCFKNTSMWSDILCTITGKT